MIAGTHSGVGKTTIATGIMAALVHRGVRVGAAKVGPDFIDPGYHRLATGTASRSLDSWMMHEGSLASFAARAAEGSDILIVEGVMGLFDGSGQPETDGSTGAVARQLGAPVLLVVDASAMSGSVAALVHGFMTFDPTVQLAGVILNQVGSEGHATLLREALEPLGVPVLGSLLRDERLVWRERHLGLIPVAEQPEVVIRSIDRLRILIERSIDLDAVMAVAAKAVVLRAPEPPSARRVARSRIALAAGPAFSFVYPDNLELFEAAGAELVPFDPLTAKHLPEASDGLYLGGGFPEVYAEALSENRPLLDEIGARVRHSLVTWAECGGLLLLCASLDDHVMTGALPNTHATMTEKLTMGYRHAISRRAGLLGPEGTELRGHEFHNSVLAPAGDALEMRGRFGIEVAGFSSPTMFASYLHQHLGATPELAERFVLATSRAPRIDVTTAIN